MASRNKSAFRTATCLSATDAAAAARRKAFPLCRSTNSNSSGKSAGFRRRFHLTISGCLGPCPLANVVLLQFAGRSMWFHSINQAKDVDSIYDYVERMLQGEVDLDLPAELAGRHFQRYLVIQLPQRPPAKRSEFGETFSNCYTDSLI